MKGFMILKKFTVISLSGGSCSLNCFYCSTKYIQSMEPTIREETLYKTIMKNYERGIKGFLVSGGFDKEGKLINLEKALQVLRKVKRELKDDVVFNIHPGLVDRKTIEDMADVIDMVDFEFAYSPKAFESKGLHGKSREEYLTTLENFMEYGPKYIVPHVMLGLPNDEVEEAIKVVASYKPYLLNFLVFIPTPGTPSSNFPIPKVEDVLEKVKLGSRLMNGKISLGCMRPYKLKEKLDEMVIKEGLAERIANPHHKFLKDLEIYDACCSLPEKYFDKFRVEKNPLSFA